MKGLFTFVLTIAFFTILSSFAQTSYYYTSKNEKLAGFVEHHKAQLQSNGRAKPSYITFSNKSQLVGTKLTVEDIQSFVMGMDSFAVVNRIKLQAQQKHELADFVQVLQKGKMNLFLHVSKFGSGKKSEYKETYILTLTGSTKEVCIYDFDHQKEELAKMFEHNGRLKNLIISGKVSQADIPNLVRAYNTYL